ncbi:hypothetical protein GH714_041514 [Hevea brasiliensis]|uniref:DUF6857 domain-containing protein n=1 Tax=Hevea brasiliensis TaxID=3981 RepID=A0A6A6MVF3_HEVBR|nr:hypothetical protein GH714_041514 [Hevea brasiliensis]
MSTETSISWDFFPPNLVKLGQKVLRQGEINLLVAVEALQEANTDTIAPHSVREETNLAFDRKLNAITWMKAALDSDLNPVSDHIKATSISMESNRYTQK